MKATSEYNFKKSFIFLSCFFLVGSLTFTCVSFADIYINILAVNSSNEQREKDVRQGLPKELTAADILDTDGLQIDYDIDEESYFVYGKITLAPKESKTLKVLIRDVWKINKDKIDEIKSEMATNLGRVKDTEFQEIAEEKKLNLLRRLEYIQQKEEEYSDNIEKRMDHFREYSSELSQIRNKVYSVKYWREPIPKFTAAKTFNLIVEFTNEGDSVANIKRKFYLPSEVKSEHVLELNGFNLRYDYSRGQSYIEKSQVLEANSSKKVDVQIVDIWNVRGEEIGLIKTRVEKSFRLLKGTLYEDSSNRLVKTIKENLEVIEDSQAIERDISDHISAFRANSKIFDTVQDDVDSLEALLDSIREEMEKSKLKNILQRISTLKNISKIAASLKKKIILDMTWKVIIGCIIFVFGVSMYHYFYWAPKAKAKKLKDALAEKDK